MKNWRNKVNLADPHVVSLLTFVVLSIRIRRTARAVQVLYMLLGITGYAKLLCPARPGTTTNREIRVAGNISPQSDLSGMLSLESVPLGGQYGYVISDPWAYR